MTKRVSACSKYENAQVQPRFDMPSVLINASAAIFSWSPNQTRIDAIQAVKQSFFGDLLFEIMGIVAWNIWKERNNFIFRHINPTLAAWRERTKSDLLWLKYRVDKAFWDYITLLARSL